jgi:hypothetical protein
LNAQVPLQENVSEQLCKVENVALGPPPLPTSSSQAVSWLQAAAAAQQCVSRHASQSEDGPTNSVQPASWPPVEASGPPVDASVGGGWQGNILAAQLHSNVAA